MTSSELIAFPSPSIGDSAEFDADLSLSDRLKIFKTSQFDHKGYITSKCRTMSEKEVKHLFAYLIDLKKASADEMRKSVYANYSAFIRTSREISDLEGELLSMRNLLSAQAALVHGLADGIGVNNPLSSDSSCGSASARSQDDSPDLPLPQPIDTDNWLIDFVDNLDVLLAERRVDESLAALDDGERFVKAGHGDGEGQTLSPTAASFLRDAIKKRRQSLADQLAYVAAQASTSGVELRSAIQALKRLGDGPHAHKLLLNSHRQNLMDNVCRIRPSRCSYGGPVTTALAHQFFSIVAQAASDSLVVFGDEPAYASELVTWAAKETERLAVLVKRHVLGTSAAAGGLRLAAECVQVCLGHCGLLEARGLALSPILLKLFRPCVEEALANNLKRIEQCSAALAAVDDWALVYPPLGVRPLGANASPLGTAIASQLKLSTSAHRFNSMVQEFFEEVGPLETLQLGGSTLDGLLQVFNTYINLLIHALPGTMETEDNPGGSTHKIVKMAETEAQQLALLANASMLADELLPRAAMKLSPSHQPGRMETPRRAADRQSRFPEHREWKRKLQRAVDRLRDSFCRQHALELIFTDDGEIRLTAETYTSIRANKNEADWFPSPLCQEFFTKLTQIASIAIDMFVGRERFATVLLMRLTETVILWLSEDQNFWAEIEAGPTPLNAFGLQQFYLDMEFVICFTSQGRYLSRNLHQVIKNVIARAIDASAAATGIDPYSVLPEDQWFVEVAQIAMKMLTGEADFGQVDRDGTSPTASVLSHGSC